MNVVVLNQYTSAVLDTPFDRFTQPVHRGCGIHRLVMMMPRVVVSTLRRVCLPVARDAGHDTLPENILVVILKTEDD